MPVVPEGAATGQVDHGLAQKGVGLASFYAHAAQGVEVAVNVETGEVKVVRFGTACDMGFPINPKMCEQQMDGGAIMGMGSALWEELILDNGKVLNYKFRDYKIPDAVNIPGLENFKTFYNPSSPYEWAVGGGGSGGRGGNTGGAGACQGHI